MTCKNTTSLNVSHCRQQKRAVGLKGGILQVLQVSYGAVCPYADKRKMDTPASEALWEEQESHKQLDSPLP